MYVLVCSVEWDGTSCAGDLSSADATALFASTAPFDWSLIDPASLMYLFSVGAGLVLTIGFAAWGARVVLDVIRKS